MHFLRKNLERQFRPLSKQVGQFFPFFVHTVKCSPPSVRRHFVYKFTVKESGASIHSQSYFLLQIQRFQVRGEFLSYSLHKDPFISFRRPVDNKKIWQSSTYDNGEALFRERPAPPGKQNQSLLLHNIKYASFISTILRLIGLY